MRSNRRELCSAMGFGTASLAWKAQAQAQTAADVGRTGTSVLLLPLSDVRIPEGPFAHSFSRNLDYLLKLEPDRLLAWFRREAGLTPLGPVYGGWESETVWGNGQSLPGATLGFYLSAMANSYAQTHDPRILDRLAYIIDQLDRCQKASGDGYLLPTKNGHQLFQRVAQGQVETTTTTINGVWEPTYVLNKVMLGLADVIRYTGNSGAKSVLLSLAHWFGAGVIDRLTDEQVQKLLLCEYGSLTESYVDCYLLSQDRRYLNWAERLCERRMLLPLAQGKDILDGWHANTQIPKFTGFQAIYSCTGDPPLNKAAVHFWTTVTRHRSWVNGGNSTGEIFFPPSQNVDRILASTGPESCNTVNMLRLTEALFANDPAPAFSDYYERALFNHVLPSHDPNRGMCCYFTSLRPEHYRTYSSEFESFWCCLNTGIQAASRYGAFIYAKAADQFFVNLFIPSEAVWKEKNVTIRQETSFPSADSTVLRIKAPHPTDFSLCLRHPWWVKQSFLAMEINGKEQAIPSQPSSYVGVRRTWAEGDEIKVKLPMTLSLEPLKPSDEYAALLFGPIVLAGALGKEGLEHESFYQKMNHFAERTIPVTHAPSLCGSQEALLSSIRRLTADQLRFEIASPDRTAPIPLLPLSSLYFERYAIYWRVFATQSQWKDYRQEIKAIADRLARTRETAVDSVIVGDIESEKSHQVEEVSTATGLESGRSFRRAREGGWLSYQLAVNRGHRNDLVLEYYGVEIEPSRFTIQIDGHEIASVQDISKSHLPVNYGQVYPIPDALLESKERVTVKLQAIWPHPTARVFTIYCVTRDV